MLTFDSDWEFEPSWCLMLVLVHIPANLFIFFPWLLLVNIVVVKNDSSTKVGKLVNKVAIANNTLEPSPLENSRL